MLFERFKEELNRIINLGYSRTETVRLINSLNDDIIVNLRIHNIITNDEAAEMIDLLYFTLERSDLIDLFIKEMLKKGVR